ncbi:MAG: heparan-alpha-glucosaminide N-acetyltransferase domain-containing protein [Chlorobiota bacterium]
MSKENKNKRIVFIDLMRAYAILMMVQGHLVDACLDPIYRDSENTLYFIWNFMRGVTAPVFFFSSGMIFTYLLMKQEKSGIGINNPRVKKGFSRFIMLLGVGYLLHFNWWFLVDLLDGSLSKSYNNMIRPDVLHIIAVAILLIVATYVLSRLTKIKMYLLLLVLAMSSFLFYPDIVSTNFDYLPRFLASYIDRGQNFGFTIIPWVGYSLFGGVLGIFIYSKPKFITNNLFAAMFILLGLLFHYSSSSILIDFYDFTGWENLKSLAFNNFQFFRLGHVFVAVGVFMLINNSKIKIPSIIPKIGAETLTIYVVHAFIIYGSIFQFGIAQSYGKSLTPWECFAIALLIEIFFFVLIYYIEDIRKYLRLLIAKLKIVAKTKT